MTKTGKVYDVLGAGIVQLEGRGKLECDLWIVSRKQAVLFHKWAGFMSHLQRLCYTNPPRLSLPPLSITLFSRLPHWVSHTPSSLCAWDPWPQSHPPPPGLIPMTPCTYPLPSAGRGGHTPLPEAGCCQRSRPRPWEGSKFGPTNRPTSQIGQEAFKLTFIIFREGFDTGSLCQLFSSMVHRQGGQVPR